MSNLNKIFNWANKFDSKKELHEYLESEGYNVNELGNRGVNLVREKLAESKLRTAKTKRANLARAKELLAERDDLENLKLLLSDLNTSNSNFAYQFSKLDVITEEDAISMLDEQGILELVEKLEQEKHGEK